MGQEVRKINLFLDDVRMPEAAFHYTMNPIYRNWKWVVVRDYNEFVEHIEKYGMPRFISFDHDLADVEYDPVTQRESFSYHEMTGYECAKWLVEYCIDNDEELPDYYVHSANPVGAKNIHGYLENFLRAKEKGII